MSKISIIVCIIAFWIILPIPMMALNMQSNDVKYLEDSINGFSTPDSTDPLCDNNNSLYCNAQKLITTIFSIIKSIFSMIFILFKIIIIGIDGLPAIFNYFFLILKMISAITVFVLMRGD